MKPRSFCTALLALAVLAASCDDNDGGPTGGTGSTFPPGFLYVLNQADNTIYAYDTETMTRLDSVPSVVEEPHFGRVSPDGEYLYVVGRRSPGQIARFHLPELTFSDSVVGPGDVFPTAIAVGPDGATGYVCDFTAPDNPGRLYRYDLADMTFSDTLLAAGAATHDLQVTSDGGVVVAGNFGTDNITLAYPGHDSVFFADVAPGDPSPPGAPRYGPYGIAIDHNDSLVFIACRLSNEIRVLDLAARRVIDSIPVPIQSGSGLAGPTLMAVAPGNDLLFVTTQLENTVAVVSLATRRVIAQLELGVPRPFGIVADSDGQRYYVACVNSENPLADRTGRVFVIDGTTRTVVDSVDVGANSFGLAWRAR